MAGLRVDQRLAQFVDGEIVALEPARQLAAALQFNPQSLRLLLKFMKRRKQIQRIVHNNQVHQRPGDPAG